MGRFQQAIDQGARDAEELLPHLQRVWRALVHEWSRHAAAQLRERAIVAAGAPVGSGTPSTWIAPTWSELAPVTSQALAAEGKTAKIRVAMVEAAMRPALVEFGLTFDVANPLVDGLLAQLGGKITRIAETQRAITMQHLEVARQKGLSIPDAAKLIVEHGSGSYSQNRAQVIARTELGGAQNGGSWAAARLVGMSTKAWLATGDSRTRKTHRAADGQQVPINEPFTVGLSLLMYPGDPSGAAEEVIQCRCTVVYPDDGASPSDAPATSEHAADAAEEPDWSNPVHGDDALRLFSDGGPMRQAMLKLRRNDPMRQSVRTYQSMAAESINAAMRAGEDVATTRTWGTNTINDSIRNAYAEQMSALEDAEQALARASERALTARADYDAFVNIMREEGEDVPIWAEDAALAAERGLGAYRESVDEVKSFLGSPDIPTFERELATAFREAGPLPQAVRTLRGLTLDDETLAAWQPGAVIEDKAYMSTAMDDGGASSGNVVLELTIPKGYHGISAADVTGRYPQEKELLLPPGTKFYIDSVEQTERRGVRINLMKVRVLPRD